LQEGLIGATKAKQIKEIGGEFLAIDTALNDLAAGDTALMLPALCFFRPGGKRPRSMVFKRATGRGSH
jgi:hypothetical protein